MAVPVSAAVALGWRRIPPWTLLAGMAAAIAPDLDVIVVKLGLTTHGGLTGHRGLTHTVLFALLLGLVGLSLAPRWGMRRWAGYAWIALCTLSHPLLDMMTNAGAGVVLLWPLDQAHHFFAWRPIEASPISLRRFLSGRGAQVLRNEAVTVWAPLMAVALLIWATRHGLMHRQRRGA
jgi:inner membrane protein